MRIYDDWTTGIQMTKETKPNFFIIGAAKAATTSLSSLLESHSEAAIGQRKEPHFFSNDRFYRLGWKEYLKLFSHCRDERAIGDASTSYSRIRYYPLTVERIAKHVPDAKIIYMVRHPLKRMESAYVEHLCSPAGQVFASVNDAVRRQPMIVDSSRYWEVFDAYREKFNESRIKIVWFEDYITNSGGVFREVCRFLEIDDSVIPDFGRERTNSRENASIRMARLGRSNVEVNTIWDMETRQWVMNQIREDNCRFLAHFGRPQDYWGNLF